MTIDNISTVVEEFTKRLQLPESLYKFTMTTTNENVELIISIEDTVKCAMNITNGNIKVLYADSYLSENYLALEFMTPITLLYQLCIMFYACAKDVAQIDFNKMLSIIFLEDVYDWRTLIYAIAENVGLETELKDDYVVIDDVEIHYSGYLNKIQIDNTEITLRGNDYTDIVEAMFKCVEYIANVMDVADNLFMPEETGEGEFAEEDNVAEAGGMPMGDEDMDIDVDMDMGEMGEEVPEEGGTPEPVEPMENEDFTEPQGPVVTMDDLL